MKIQINSKFSFWRFLSTLMWLTISATWFFEQFLWSVRCAITSNVPVASYRHVTDITEVAIVKIVPLRLGVFYTLQLIFSKLNSRFQRNVTTVQFVSLLAFYCIWQEHFRKTPGFLCLFRIFLTTSDFLNSLPFLFYFTHFSMMPNKCKQNSNTQCTLKLRTVSYIWTYWTLKLLFFRNLRRNCTMSVSDFEKMSLDTGKYGCNLDEIRLAAWNFITSVSKWSSFERLKCREQRYEFNSSKQAEVRLLPFEETFGVIIFNNDFYIPFANIIKLYI